MRVVITGGSGFLGKPVINILLRKGHSIMALSRTAEAYNLVNTEKSLEWINTSLELDETCFQQIKDFKPEAIVHLAWEKIPDFSFLRLEKKKISTKVSTSSQTLHQC